MHYIQYTENIHLLQVTLATPSLHVILAVLAGQVVQSFKQLCVLLQPISSNQTNPSLQKN